MEKEKHIDETWKETAKQEKEASKECGPDCSCTDHGADESHQKSPGEISFINYITSLGFQAMIFLGEVPNPITQKEEKDLDHAKMLIDTLVMLRDKTNGNLSEQESNILNASIYELQMKYVELANKEQKTL